MNSLIFFQTSYSAAVGQSTPLSKSSTLNPDTISGKKENSTGSFCILVVNLFYLFNEIFALLIFHNIVIE